MRLPRVVALVTTIVAIALAAAPVIVSRTPTPDTALTTAGFQPVTLGIAPSAATTIPVPAEANESESRVDGEGGLFVDPEAAHAADAAAAGPLPWSLPGPAAEVPDPSPVVVVKATPPPPRRAPVAAAPAGGAATAGGSSGGVTWNTSQASFYGPGFYGHGMACTGVLTETLRGVAHKTLPCGTLVTFRNPSNGTVLTVPVVDRGPYVAGREWDLTGGACVALDFCYTGAIQWHLGGQ